MGGGGNKEARRARKTEEERIKRVKEGTANIRQKFASSFGDKYYKDLSDASVAKDNLSLDKQYTDALDEIKYALARSGTLDSSAFVTRDKKLLDSKLLADKDIQDRARGEVNRRRAEVAGGEETAVGQLIASGDANAAGIQAAHQIATYTDLPQFQPLGQLFTDAAAGLATQADLERQGQNRYNMGVSSWYRPNSSRYTTTVR